MTRAESQLVATATALGEMRRECVFVGGGILCVYVGRTPPPRVTNDVDIVVTVGSAVDPGDDEGERAAEIAVERMRRIAALSDRRSG